MSGRRRLGPEAGGDVALLLAHRVSRERRGRALRMALLRNTFDRAGIDCPRPSTVKEMQKRCQVWGEITGMRMAA